MMQVNICSRGKQNAYLFISHIGSITTPTIYFHLPRHLMAEILFKAGKRQQARIKEVLGKTVASFHSNPKMDKLTTILFVSTVAILLIIMGSQETKANLQELYSWNVLDFYYTGHQKIEAILKEDFIPENNLPVGIEVWEDKIFVTVPRWKPGNCI